MKYLLDRIGETEAPYGYGTVYGNMQGRLAKPLQSWTIAEIIGAKPSFTARFGSSACGRYQFMRDTLSGLVAQGIANATWKFTAEVQDQLGAALLRRRGYDRFVNGEITLTQFGRALAQEWASFPVLASTRGAHRDVLRGQTYYLGDGVNKVLVNAPTVEAWLANVLRLDREPAVALVTPEPVVAAPEVPAPADNPLSRIWALVQGRPPVAADDRKAVVQEVKAAREEVPHVGVGLGGIRLAGLGGLFASLAGGAQDTGLLSTVQGTADQATQTFQSVQTLVNIVLGAVRWGVTHWWVFGLMLSLYVLVKVGWAVYGTWMQIQQWRATNAALATIQATKAPG